LKSFRLVEESALRRTLEKIGIARATFSLVSAAADLRKVIDNVLLHRADAGQSPINLASN
jgi:hypothetical protein